MRDMARIIAIVNQKGGVGKTTTAINLSYGLTKKEKKVLLVDMDAQANATSGIGADSRAIEKSVYHVLVEQIPVREALFSSAFEALHIVPANVDLAGAAVELVSAPEREFRLRNSIQEVSNQYDFIIIDCPPSLGLLTINGLVAANEILIPVQTEYYALEGLGQLVRTLELVREHLHPDLKILGAVLTMFDKRNNLSAAVVEDMRKNFPERVFETVIPRNVRLAEAPSYGKPILEYDRHSPGALAYQNLVEELLNENINV